MAAAGENWRRARDWLLIQWHRSHRYQYRIINTIIIVGTGLLILFVHFGVMGAETGTFLAVLGATAVAGLLVNETREDRLTHHRPHILVDFLRSDDVLSSASLNIRNIGNAVATDIYVTLQEPVRAHTGKYVSENPLLRRGIRLLAPGYVMSLKLHENALLETYMQAEPVWTQHTDENGEKTVTVDDVRKIGATPTVTATVIYHDESGEKEYKDTFTIDVAENVHGWTIRKE